MKIRMNNEFYTILNYEYDKQTNIVNGKYDVKTVSDFSDSEEEKNAFRKLLKDTFWFSQGKVKKDLDALIYLAVIDKNGKLLEVPIQQFSLIEVE